MWVAVVVPVAVLLLAVLLQRLEAAVLTVPDSAGRPNGPRSADPTHPDPAGAPGVDPTRIDALDAQRAPLALVPPEEPPVDEDGGEDGGEDAGHAPGTAPVGPSGRERSPRSVHRLRPRAVRGVTG